MSHQCDCLNAGKIEVRYLGLKDAEFAVVGESPGREEERARPKPTPFVGRAGQLIKELFHEAGLVWSDAAILNSARCLMDKAALKPKGTRAVMAACRPNLEAALHAIKPKAILALGGEAMFQLIRKEKITKYRGTWYWSDEFNCWVFPTFHPAACLRQNNLTPLVAEDLRRFKEVKDRDWKLTDPNAVNDYKEAQSLTAYLEALKQNKKSVIMSLDTETTALDSFADHALVLVYSVSVSAGRARMIRLYEECEEAEAEFTVPVKRIPPTIIGPKGGKKIFKTPKPFTAYVKRAANFEEKIENLIDIITSPLIKLVMVNGNFDRRMIDATFRRIGLSKSVQMQSFVMECQVAAHILHETVFKQASLETMQFALTDKRDDYSRTFAMNHNYADMLSVPNDDMIHYSCADADTTLQVAESIAERMTLPEHRIQQRYFKEVAQPTVAFALYELEKNGSRIDLKQLPKVKAEVAQKLTQLTNEAIRLIPSAVRERHKSKGLKLTRRELLIDTLFRTDGYAIPVKKKRNSQELDFSLDKDRRVELLEGKLKAKARDFITIYDEWSTLNTLYTRYLNGFEKHVKSDGRIHSTYSTVRAATGRTSSAEPNMQNNPKRSKAAKIIRRLIVAPKGKVLLAVDAGQAELRWAAHLSNDPAMIEVFQSGQDIHTATAMELSGSKWKTMDKKEIDKARRNAKCFHPSTEVLTRSGWVALKDLQPGTEIMQAHPEGEGDSLRVGLSWCLPDLKFKPNHCKTLVHLSNEGMNITVTPDHRMLCEMENKSWKVTTPHDLDKVGRYWWNAGILDNQDYIEGDDTFLQLLVASWADGSRSGMNGIRFGFSKQRKIDRLRSLLKDIPHTETVYSNGGNTPSTCFYVGGDYGKRLCSALAPNGTANDYHKQLPWWLMSLSPRQRLVVLEESAHWDGCKLDNWKSFRVGQVKRESLDVLQALAVTTGRKSKLTQSKDGFYSLAVSDKPKSRTGNLKLEEYDYSDQIALLSVPSTFVVARSGKGRQVPVIIGQTVNFGVLYLMSPQGFVIYAKKEFGVNIDVQTAEQWIETFFRKYKRLRIYHKDTIRFCRQHGYVVSPFGRRRHFPDINSSIRGLQSAAEKAAVNHPIQSASSDTVLMSLNEILIRKLLDPDKAKLVNFIHDEVVFEVTDNSQVIEDTFKIIKHEMEHPPLHRLDVTLRVPLEADGKVGHNLAEMEELS